MPDVRDGLEIAGEPANTPTPDVFGADKLAAPLPAEPDPGSDSAEAIRQAVLHPDTTIDVAGAIQYPDEADLGAAKLESLEKVTLEGEEFSGKDIVGALNAAGNLLEHEDAERQAGRAAQEQLALQEFEYATSSAVSESELVQAVADFKSHASEDGFDAALWSLAGDLNGIDPDPEYADEDDLETVGETYDRLNQQADAVLALRHAVAADQMIRELSPIVMEQRAKETAGLIREWQLETGLMGDAARARLQQIEAAVREHHNLELGSLMAHATQPNPELFAALLRSEDAAMESVDREFRHADIRQAIFDADETNVQAALTQVTPFGEMYLQPRPEFQPSQERIDARAVAGAQASRASAGAIKQSLLERSGTSVSDSLTDNGQPISVGDALAKARARNRGQQRG